MPSNGIKDPEILHLKAGFRKQDVKNNRTFSLGFKYRMSPYIGSVEAHKILGFMSFDELSPPLQTPFSC